MQTTENKQWQDEQALNRYQLIAPCWMKHWIMQNASR